MNYLFIAYENDEWRILWSVLALQRLFHFIACVLFLSISFLFCLWILQLAEVLR